MNETLNNLIKAASGFGLNYVFVDKHLLDNDTIEHLKGQNYSILIGQGTAARIKISW